MPKYNYTLTDDVGKKTMGSISATNRSAALQKLREEGKIVLALTRDGKRRKWLFGRPSMSHEDKMMFVKNLSTMLKVGINITEALQIFRDQTENKGLKKMFEDLLDMINSGQNLSKSLRKYDNNFSEIFINMIATGEAAGNLEKVLSYLDMQMEKEYEIRKKIISAFIYPIIIICITLLMATGIVVFIIPKITKIFRTFKADLPLPTKILINLSGILTEKPILSLLAVVLSVGFLVLIFKLKALKPMWHKIILSLPVFGHILVSANVARFSRTMNSLLQASVPVTDAIRTTANMLDNYFYKKALMEVADKVEQGGKIGKSLEEHPKLFPTMCTRLIFLGEKTGTLESITDKVADLYEKETDSKTKNLSVLVEPLLLVFMAGIVGGMAISIIMPIYQLPNLISK